MKTPKEARDLIESMKAVAVKREAQLYRLSRYICPWRGRLPEQEGTDPYQREGHTLFTVQATDCVLRGASGMTSGMTPRNIAWFKSGFNEPGLMELSGVREWLDQLDARMRETLAEGGFYQAIQNFNLDLLWSGAGLLYAEQGERQVLNYMCVQPGSYLVQTDTLGDIETAARKISMTLAEAARRFGRDSLSETARKYLARQPMRSFTLWHLASRLEKPDGLFTVESCYLEEGVKDRFLATGGYHEMPYFYTVWNEGATPYGTGPGDNALCDAMQLDELERMKLEGLAKLVNPPTMAPVDMRDALDLAPGAINYYSGSQQIRPVIDLSPYASALSGVQNEIAIVRGRLESQLMASVFSSMPLDQRPGGMSATEFLERKRDALQQLGPIMSAYEPRVLVPLLLRTALTLDREGYAPPLPDTLKNLGEVFMKMEFISPMANALRQTGAETTRALLMDVANMVQATGKTELLDKLNLEQMVDELATGLGSPGSILRSDEDVAKLREERQRQAEVAQQAEEVKAMLLNLAGNMAGQAPGQAAGQTPGGAPSGMAAQMAGAGADPLAG